MAERLGKTRKYVWKITDFTRESYVKYGKGTKVVSDSFEFFIGENKTRW
jgi:transposase